MNILLELITSIFSSFFFIIIGFYAIPLWYRVNKLHLTIMKTINLLNSKDIDRLGEDFTGKDEPSYKEQQKYLSDFDHYQNSSYNKNPILIQLKYFTMYVIFLLILAFFLDIVDIMVGEFYAQTSTKIMCLLVVNSVINYFNIQSEENRINHRILHVLYHTPYK